MQRSKTGETYRVTTVFVRYKGELRYVNPYKEGVKINKTFCRGKKSDLLLMNKSCGSSHRRDFWRGVVVKVEGPS